MFSLLMLDHFLICLFADVCGFIIINIARMAFTWQNGLDQQNHLGQESKCVLFIHTYQGFLPLLIYRQFNPILYVGNQMKADKIKLTVVVSAAVVQKTLTPKLNGNRYLLCCTFSFGAVITNLLGRVTFRLWNLDPLLIFIYANIIIFCRSVPINFCCPSL